MKFEALSLLENASWPALVVDPAGQVLETNKAGRSFFPSDQSGSWTLASIWAAENRNSAAEFIQEADNTPRANVAIKLKDASGGAPAYSASITRFSEGAEKRFLLQFFPATSPLRESNSPGSDSAQIQKQKLDCALQLARSVSLDFNNVLTSILGHTSLILSKLEIAHPWRKPLLEVEKAAARAAEISNDLASFSRQETKASTQAEGNLNPVLQRCVEFFQKNPSAEPITWTLQLERGLFAARFDQLKIQQALLRILENSVQAIQGSGRITVQTRNVLLEQATQDRNVKLVPGAYVCAEISDTGCGIEPDVLPRIFEPFFTTKRGTNHRGLGLAWVYGIVTNHGGGVAVSSQPGVGTSVRLYVPAEKRIVVEHPGPAEDLRGKETVLVVDDEELVLNMANTILSEHGYKVFTATSGAKALEVLKRNTPAIDLVVTDLIMPGMSGRELVDQIRQVEPGMPIISTSGYVWPGTQPRDQNFLQKPFTAQDLLRKIRLIVRNKRGREIHSASPASASA